MQEILAGVIGVFVILVMYATCMMLLQELDKSYYVKNYNSKTIKVFKVVIRGFEYLLTFPLFMIVFHMNRKSNKNITKSFNISIDNIMSCIFLILFLFLGTTLVINSFYNVLGLELAHTTKYGLFFSVSLGLLAVFFFVQLIIVAIVRGIRRKNLEHIYLKKNYKKQYAGERISAFRKALAISNNIQPWFNESYLVVYDTESEYNKDPYNLFVYFWYQLVCIVMFGCVIPLLYVLICPAQNIELVNYSIGTPFTNFIFKIFLVLGIILAMLLPFIISLPYTFKNSKFSNNKIGMFKKVTFFNKVHVYNNMKDYMDDKENSQIKVMDKVFSRYLFYLIVGIILIFIIVKI